MTDTANGMLQNFLYYVDRWTPKHLWAPFIIHGIWKKKISACCRSSNWINQQPHCICWIWSCSGCFFFFPEICGIEWCLYCLSDRYCFVPNGGRIYYERRSQPPFLTLIVESLYQATKDKEFLRWYLGSSWSPARHIIILQVPRLLCRMLKRECTVKKKRKEKESLTAHVFWLFKSMCG